jgi:hypothetical protein
MMAEPRFMCGMAYLMRANWAMMFRWKVCSTKSRLMSSMFSQISWWAAVWIHQLYYIVPKKRKRIGERGRKRKKRCYRC